jgi:16S rRNA (guanine527-N7)-methyltransferase
MHPLAARLSGRAAAAGVALPDPLRDRLLTYYDLLNRWNTKINLTALNDPDEAIDRLLLEPVAAASFLPARTRLMDLGSGGGSPAIPLALALGSSSLLMVESKSRKAAFLREAARAVGLDATVESERFEDLAKSERYASAFDLVSMRAVRMDERTLVTAAHFASPAGCVALFVTTGTSLAIPPTLRVDGRFALIGNAELLRLISVPRGTSS